MIASYKQLTGKYLKANRRRSVLTIIGIILSVALISSIGLFFLGVQDAQIQSAKDTYGSYHLAFQKTNEKLISEIINNPKVSRSGLYSIGKDIKLKKDMIINEITATDKALELFPFRVKQGKLPEKANEVAMEQWVLNYINKNAKIGDVVKINNRASKVVGILDNSIQSQINNRAILLYKNNNIDKENAGLLVEISSKTDLKAGLKELKQLGEKSTVKENTFLIIAEGAGDDSSGARNLYIVIGIIIGIVVISTIAVIYNAFQISVVERIKQFGLLRAVGGTPKQIKKMVLREATFLAIIGVPLGLLCGVIAIYGIGFTIKLIGGESIMPVKLSISPKIMGFSGILGLLSIYISALLPALNAGRISPLTAISGRNSITKEKIKRRKSIIIQRIFGFEGALAFKNIKRSRRRYRITVFSIIISVMLFITFKSFMDAVFTVSTVLNESNNVHFSVVKDYTNSMENKNIDNKIIDNIKALKFVDKVYKGYSSYPMDVAINNNSTVKEVVDMGGVYKNATFEGIDKVLINSSIEIYDEDAMQIAKAYLSAGSLDIKKLNGENGAILINKNVIYNRKTNKNYYGPIVNLKVGDVINLQYDNPNTKEAVFGKGNVRKVKVMAILRSDPFDYTGNSSGIKIITTEVIGKKLVNLTQINPINLGITIKNIKDEDKAKIGIENAIKSNSSIKVIDNIDQNRRGKTILLMMRILMYGFVIVVSLIGSVNIINTVTTNIIVRKREFATLKSIGLTQRGLRKMIVLEGLLYGIVGSIYGSIIGCGLSYIMDKGIGGVREFGWRVPYNAIAIASTAAILIGFLSVLAPLSRIKRENLIQAVREDY